MSTTYMAKPGEFPRNWWLVDANGLILGRLAAKVARILMGKTKPQYTPHIDTGDFVVVVNASKVAVTGDKLNSKEYQTFSGYPHGQKRKPLSEMLAKRPDEVIRLAVKRMLPKSRLGRKMLLKLKIHDQLPAHQYKAQQPKPLALEEAAAAAAK
jgi:large subunit ribosomal protein L13